MHSIFNGNCPAHLKSALFHTLAPVRNVLPEGIRDQKAADHLLLAWLLMFTDFIFFCVQTKMCV